MSHTDGTRDTTRLFSRRAREAVALVTGQSGEADHITPWAAGGRTTVENCQLLPAEMNRRKGVEKYEPRDWQIEFHDKWENRAAGRPFLLSAIPGSGKTMAALETARRWMAAGADRRVIVVVPTDNLREQWKVEAGKPFGIALQGKEFGTNFKDGMHGAVTTYHTVANNPLVFRKLCSVAPTMVILDEVHHCGDEAHFGIGVSEAFELTKERLLLSGTPWKSDGTAIPYVTYNSDGRPVADFRYDYKRALAEGVVRYCVFDYARATLTSDLTGDQNAFSTEMDEDEAARLLRHLLQPDGDFVREQINRAHQRLISLRQRIPDAAAMAVCIDQAHAQRVAKTIRQVTGCEPSVIVSDTAVENDTVQKFRASASEWLVSVRKVSEGTDIPRLQVLCYLTNVTSELFFQQIVGRVSRVRKLEDHEAYVYLPADPRLVQCAKNIEAEQMQALRTILDDDDSDVGRDPRAPRQYVFPLESYSNAHDGIDLVLLGSETVPPDVAREYEQWSAVTGVPMAKVAQLARLMRADTSHKSSPTPTPFRPKEDVMDELRRRINKKAFALACVLGVDVKEIHGRFRPHAQMSEEELRAKLAWITSQAARMDDRSLAYV